MGREPRPRPLAVSSRRTFVAPPVGRFGAVLSNKTAHSSRKSSLAPLSFDKSGEMLPAVAASAGASGLARRLRIRLEEREPALARARVDGVDRRPLRLPDRRLRLRRTASAVRRPSGSSSSRASSLLRSLPRSPECSATATRASAFSSSPTSPASSSSAQLRSACSLDAAAGSSTGSSIAATIATTPFRSSQAALTPSLARTPEELTAANAVASGVESVAVFAGPALAGLLLAVAATESSSQITALLIVVSALFLLLIRVDAANRHAASSMRRRSRPSASPDSQTLGRNPSARMMVASHGPDGDLRQRSRSSSWSPPSSCSISARAASAI